MQIMEQAKDSQCLSDEKKNYLSKISEYKEKWCLAFKKEEQILGIQTTSRLESLNSMTKSIISTKCSLTELIIRLIEFGHVKNSQEREEQKENELLKVFSKSIVLSHLKERYTDFIYAKCALNFVTALNFKSSKKKTNIYEVTPIDSTQNFKYSVEISEFSLCCTCTYFKQWGIACCHIFSVVNIAPEKLKDYLVFNKRWERNIDFQIDENLVNFLKTRLSEEINTSGTYFCF